MRRGLVILPHASDVLYGLMNGANGVVKSTDGGLTWSPAADGLPAAIPSALTPDPTQPSVVYAGMPGYGVYRTVNGGATWEPFGTGLQGVAVNAVALGPGGRAVYVGSWGGGVYKHADPLPHVESLPSACARRPPP